MEDKNIFTAPEHPLKNEFKKLGVPQKKIAHSLGCSYQTIFRMFNGYQKMTAGVEKRLNELYERLKS